MKYTLWFCLFAALPVFGGGRPPSSLKGTKPNIIIILADDSGYSDLGCYGGEIDTPNLDKLAKGGLRVSNFYTNGRCSPTRASLLSGMDSARVGFGGGSLGGWWREVDTPAHRSRLPYETPLLPELMKEQGYRTMMAGKWHLGGSLMKEVPGLQKEWGKYHKGWGEVTEEEIEADFLGLPAQRGFDKFFGTIGAECHFFVTPDDNHNYLEGNSRAQLSFDREYTMHCYAKPGTMYDTKNHGATKSAFYDTDGTTDRAIKMIEDASGDKEPFLLYLAYRAPHLPLQAPEELVQKYMPLYEDLEKMQTARNEGLVGQQMFPADAGIKQVPDSGNSDLQLKLALHAAMVEKVDENVGRVIQALKENGELENTLILYFSDNGAASHTVGVPNTPYRGCKALVWEGGTKSHFIASWPGKIKAGGISDDVTWVGDVLPTCLELAGGTYPETFRGEQARPLDGRSMLPVLQGESTVPPETLFFNDKGQQTVIYQGRWKLLIEPGWYSQTIKDGKMTYELYDLHADPAETKNLAKKNQKMVKMLEQKAEEWREDLGIWDYADILKERPNDFH